MMPLIEAINFVQNIHLFQRACQANTFYNQLIEHFITFKVKSSFQLRNKNHENPLAKKLKDGGFLGMKSMSQSPLRKKPMK